VDNVGPGKRSLIMAAVRSQKPKQEISVRQLVHGMGYRYRLHAKGLPGHPDIVFRSRQKILFVHGCFWHRHQRCRYATSPKTRIEFWNEKFDRNIARDQRDQRALKQAGWSVMIVWQCELKNHNKLARRINDFLKKDS